MCVAGGPQVGGGPTMATSRGCRPGAYGRGVIVSFMIAWLQHGWSRPRRIRATSSRQPKAHAPSPTVIAEVSGVVIVVTAGSDGQAPARATPTRVAASPGPVVESLVRAIGRSPN